MKFGGTSMAGTERIRRVARIVQRQQAGQGIGGGHEVTVVVSAMAGETDRLVNFCREANTLYDPAEYDVVVASGGTPVARIVPYLEHREPRRPGLLAGRILIADDFDAPLPEFEDDFYG